MSDLVICEKVKDCGEEKCPHRKPHKLSGSSCLGRFCSKFGESVMCIPSLVSTEKDVAHQDHYEYMKIQPIQFMAASLPPEKFKGFLEGNIIKYVCRSDKKDGLKDLKKAAVYLNWLIEYNEKGTITV